MQTRNKKSQKLLALLLAAMMALSMLPMSAFAGGSDIEGHWAEDTLQSWSDKGWFTGDGAGTYRPDAGITRAEFMALINRMKSYTGESADVAKYTDVARDSWYYSTVATALQAGYITGTSDTTMSPDTAITRQEAMTIIARIEGISTDSTVIISKAADSGEVASWAKSFVAACIENGLVAGAEGRINPTSNITRAESVVLMDRVDTNVRTYSFAGTYGPASGTLEVAAVNIIGADVTLQNAKVKGDLTVAASVGDGDVTLNHVDVLGKLIVRGGGLNSVNLNNCTVEEIVVEKDRVRVVVAGKSTVNTISVTGDEGILALTGDTTVKTLTIAGDDAQVTAGSGVTANAVNVEGSGNTIETEKGTTFNTVTVSGSGTEIAGEVDIKTANITGEDTVIESKPGTTNVAEGITANVDNKDVTGTTTGGGSTGGGGSSGGSSGGQTEVAVTGVTLKPTIGEVYAGETLTLTATVAPATATNKTVTWKSSDPEVATVTGGVVTGVAGETGTVTITATTEDGNHEATCLVTVVEPAPEKTLALIYIANNPTKLVYTTADTELVLTGLVVKAVYSDGTEAIITPTSVTGFTAGVLGTYPIEVSYTEGEITKKVENAFTASVVAAPPETGNYTLTAIVFPWDNIDLQKNGESAQAIIDALPAQVEIIYREDGKSDDLTTSAPVTWAAKGTLVYDSEKPDLQRLTYTCTVTTPLPGGIKEGSVTLSKDVTVNIIPKQYTVTYNLNGALGSVPVELVYHGGTIDTAPAPVREGYNLDGWYTEAEGGTKFIFGDGNEATTITDNITLYAKWNADTYTVTFDTNEGSTAPANQTINYGGTVTKPADPTKEGFTFDGWFVDDAANAYDFSTQVTESFALTAKWTEKTYTVTFNSDGGSAVAAITGVAYDGKVTKPADPTKDGYIFDGWYTNDKFETAFVFGAEGTPITDDTTLYAKWAAVKYTVNFYYNYTGASTEPFKTVGYKEGDNIGALASDPFREGYIVAGWYTEAACTNKFEFLAQEITQSYDFYAGWVSKEALNAAATAAVKASSEITDLDKITGNLTLPASVEVALELPATSKFTFDSLEWASNNAAIEIAGTTGTVTRGNEDTSVALTVKRIGSGIQLATVNVTVLAAPVATTITISDTGDGSVILPTTIESSTSYNTLSAEVKDQYNGVMANPAVTWALVNGQGEAATYTGVSIDSDGVLAIQSTASVGNIYVAATSGTVTSEPFAITIAKNAQIPTTVTVTDVGNITLPASNEAAPVADRAEEERTLAATVKDQYEDAITEPVVTWALVDDQGNAITEPITGVSIVEGKLTVTSAAAAGTIYVQATCGTAKSTVTSVVIAEATNVLTSIEITGLNKVSETDPGVKYTLTGKDQYNKAFTAFDSYTILWTLEPAEVEGTVPSEVTIDGDANTTELTIATISAATGAKFIVKVVLTDTDFVATLEVTVQDTVEEGS